MRPPPGAGNPSRYGSACGARSATDAAVRLDGDRAIIGQAYADRQLLAATVSKLELRRGQITDRFGLKGEPSASDVLHGTNRYQMRICFPIENVSGPVA